MAEPLLLWSTALAGFGAALGLFFGAVLLFKRSELKANDFLAAFCLCFAVLMMGDVLALASGVRASAWVGNALDWVFLLLPPLFYFYVRTLVTGAHPRTVLLLLSFLPAAVSALWFAAQFALARAQPAQAAAGNTDFMPTGYTVLFVAAAVTQLLAYCIAAYRLARIHARRIEQQYSSVQKVNLRWVQALIWGAVVTALCWIAGIVVQHPAWAALNAALPALMILTLGVLAQRQAPVAVAVVEAVPPEQQTRSAAAAKYAKSGLTQERMQAVADQLAQFMAHEKAFLEGDLTLGQLAMRISVPQHQISQVLNQHLCCSFFDYVNRLRVEEAKRCLADAAYSGQTVLEVGLAAGFNSKAAFNAAFKRFAGMTPTAFRGQVS
jgi:AraC-like DNA-binding protein